MSPTLSPRTLARLGIRADWVGGKSARQILSAAGHPGYSRDAAERILAAVESGADVHGAVYAPAICFHGADHCGATVAAPCRGRFVR